MYTTLLCVGALTARRMGIGGGNEYPSFRISCRIIPAYQSSRLFCIHHTPHFDNVSFVGNSPEQHRNSFPQAGKYSKQHRNWSQREALLIEFCLARMARIFASQKPSKLAFPQAGKYLKHSRNSFPQAGKCLEHGRNSSAQVGKYAEHGGNVSAQVGKCSEHGRNSFPQVGKYPEHGRDLSAQVGICPEPCGGSAARFCAGLDHIGILPPRVCGGIFRMKRRLA